MASITSQGDLEKGLQPIDTALKPVSEGKVSNKGMHIPDLDILDAKNVMPTLYGYTSFFGKNSKIGSQAIKDNVQDVISYRTYAGNTILIAMCDGGLYIKSLAGDDTLAFAVALITETATEVTINLQNDTLIKWRKFISTVPTAPFKNWTYAIIKNKLYLYQKGLGKVLRLDGDVFGTIVFQKLDPSYIIGTGQTNVITINVEDDSDQPAGGTYKEFEYLLDGIGLGKYRVPLGSAAKVSRAPEYWEQILSNSGTFAVTVDETSRTETDFTVRAVAKTNHPQDLIASGDTISRYTAAINGPKSRISISAPGVSSFTAHRFDLTNAFNFSFTDNVNVTITIGDGDYIHSENIIYNATDNSSVKQLAIQTALNNFVNWCISEVTFDKDIYIESLFVSGYFRFSTWQGKCWPRLVFSENSEIYYDLCHVEITNNITATTTIHDLDNGSVDRWSTKTADSTRDPMYNLNLGYFYSSIQDNVSVPTAGNTIWLDVPGVSVSVVANGIKTIATLIQELFSAVHTADPTNYGVPYTFSTLVFMEYLNTSYSFPTVAFRSNQDFAFYFPIPGINYYTTNFLNSPDQGIYPWYDDKIYFQLTGFNYGDSDNILINTYNQDDEIISYHTIDINPNLYDTIEDALLADSTNWTSVNSLQTERCQTAFTITLAISQLNDTQVPTTATDKDGTTLFTVDPISSTPDQLAQVEGIFSARDRLGAWTIQNRIHWSSASDAEDFTPSKITQANELIVNAVRGNIVYCLGYDNGFVIYATGNVTVGRYVGGQFIFDFKPIEQSSGSIDPRHISGSVSSHYYWSELGLQVVLPNKMEAQIIDPTLTDWLNTYRFPIKISIINNRFLAIGLQYSPDTFSYRQARQETTPNELQLGNVVKPFNPVTVVDFPVVGFGRNLFPTFKRTLLFDIILSRWGTCDTDHKCLYSLNPMNQQGFPIEKDYWLRDASLQNELRGLAVIDENNFSWLADTKVDDAYVLFGKYAAHRYKETKLVELFSEFVNKPVDTVIQIERTIEEQEIYDITTDTRIDGIQNRLDQNLAGNWFNLLVRGDQFHLKRFMVRGYAYGR